jgi:hypothetical protein
LHTGVFSKHRQANRGLMVDFESQFRIQVAQGVIRQARQVHNRVEAFEIGGLNIAHILSKAGYLGGRMTECRSVEEAAVQTDDFVPFRD